MKIAVLLLLIAPFSLLADDPWPRVKSSEVRDFEWRFPPHEDYRELILPNMTFKPGVITAGDEGA